MAGHAAGKSGKRAAFGRRDPFLLDVQLSGG
jgi:hypothetical protein